jgi:hypothetical protein
MKSASNGSGGLNLISSNDSFLIRRRYRELSRQLTQQIVLGYAFGSILLIFSAFKYFLSIGSYDIFWLAAMCIGAVFIAITLIAPFLVRPLERFLRLMGNMVGRAVMFCLLIVTYYLLIAPVGFLLRRMNGTKPIYSWKERPLSHMEGWHDKALPHDVAELAASGGKNKYARTGLTSVMLFFARGGKLIFIPAVLLLVVFGLVLFFLQTSVIAPFIYTLF